MKKIFFIGILLLITVSVFAQIRGQTVEEYTGNEWQILSELEKTAIVDGFLSGFSVWRDYIFDLDTQVYEKYQSYDKFLKRDGVVEKIVQDLDRYYIINKDNHKYEDRITNMIIVFYGKYWWQ